MKSYGMSGRFANAVAIVGSVAPPENGVMTAVTPGTLVDPGCPSPAEVPRNDSVIVPWLPSVPPLRQVNVAVPVAAAAVTDIALPAVEDLLLTAMAVFAAITEAVSPMLTGTPIKASLIRDLIMSNHWK